MNDTTTMYERSQKHLKSNGGYETHREGVDKLAHDAWAESTTWNLTRDEFIRISYFNGCLEKGSTGFYPINGSGNDPYDVVYCSEDGGIMNRNMVTNWLNDYHSYIRGFKKAYNIMGNLI